MSNNVIPFNGYTKLDIDAAEVLRAIADQKPEHVFVIAWHEGDNEPAYHSSSSDSYRVANGLHSFLHKFYNGDFGE